MPQSSGSSSTRGPDSGSGVPPARSNPPRPTSARNESILIPPARTPPDDHPEDYRPPRPPQPSVTQSYWTEPYQAVEDDDGGFTPPEQPFVPQSYWTEPFWAEPGWAPQPPAGEPARVAGTAVLPSLDQLPDRPFGSSPAVTPQPGPGPARATAATWDPTAADPADGTVPDSTLSDSTLPESASDRRQFHRFAGAAVMTAILAEGHIMEVSDVLAASPVQLALDRADGLLDDLLSAHEAVPPAHILAQTARLRRGLERLGRRSMPSPDARRREVLTGRVAVLGADAAFKLGDIDAARALTELGFRAGDSAGEGALRGTAREVAAVNEFYAGRPDEALRLARDGLTHIGTGPVRARLVCQEARALAALGDVRGAARALDTAYDLADEIPVDQWGRPGPSFDEFNPVEVSYNATTALCLLGRPAAAQEHAELALPKLDAMPAPGFRSVIRLDLALALARQGRLELERVCDLATEAIEISWGRTVASVSGRADQLLAVTRSHSEVRQVRDLAVLVREWQRSAVDQRPGRGAVPVPNAQAATVTV